jgi:fructose-bisphosphate aldolase class II
MTTSTAGLEARTTRARELMARSRDERFAVGAFNADDLATVRTICRAAHATSAPVLIEVSHSEVEALGLENVRTIVDNEIAELGVEVYLNLDHAPTVAAAMDGVDAGYEFVHLDLFQSFPLASAEDVVVATRHVVGYALMTGALVEGEQHHFPGTSSVHRDDVPASDVSMSRTTPDDARRFVEATGVDTLAVGIGNVHGRYRTPTRLNVDLLTRIRAAVDRKTNLSLHGGSQTPPSIYEALARAGINKINVNSDIRYVHRTMLERVLAGHPDEYASTRLMGPVNLAVQHAVESKIRAFGAVGKARRAVAMTRRRP